MSELISGRDAWLANFDGEEVQYRDKENPNERWFPFNDGSTWNENELKSGEYVFRIKPKVVKPVITTLNKDWSVTYSFHDQNARKEFMDKVEGLLNV